MAKVTKVRRTSTTAKKQSTSSSQVILPTERNIPPEDLSESIILLYGQKGIGKSSLAAQFENALTFMFEKGRRNLKIYQVPGKGEPKLTWETFCEYVEAFLESDFNTGVMDTIDGAYLSCFTHICSEHGVTDPSEYKEGYKLWDEIATTFASIFSIIQDSKKSLVLLSHDKTRPLLTKKKGLKRVELDEEAITSYERLEPTCKPAAFRFVQEICDFVFYYGYRDGYRSITVRSPHNVHWVSCGVDDRFFDPEGNPIETFKVGNNPEQAYADLLSAFNNELYDIDYVAPAVPRKKKLRRPTK